jgi:hypothetical protein
MKKKKTKGNPRRQPKKKAIKNPASPWHKYRTPAPRATETEIIIPPVSDADALADEVEAMEHDPDAESPEESE